TWPTRWWLKPSKPGTPASTSKCAAPPSAPSRCARPNRRISTRRRQTATARPHRHHHRAGRSFRSTLRADAFRSPGRCLSLRRTRLACGEDERRVVADFLVLLAFVGAWDCFDVAGADAVGSGRGQVDG